MEIPEGLKFTKEHEWVRIEGDTAVVGISHFAQDELGELVYFEPPEVGNVIEKGASLCVVESTKAASDVYAPIGGAIVEVNPDLGESPSLVNESPYNTGWMVKLSSVNKEELGELLSVEEYRDFTTKG